MPCYKKKKKKLIKDEHMYLAEKSYRQSIEGQVHFLLDAYNMKGKEID